MLYPAGWPVIDGRSHSGNRFTWVWSWAASRWCQQTCPEKPHQPSSDDQNRKNSLTEPLWSISLLWCFYTLSFCHWCIVHWLPLLRICWWKHSVAVLEKTSQSMNTETSWCFWHVLSLFTTDAVIYLMSAYSPPQGSRKSMYLSGRTFRKEVVMACYKELYL